MNKQNNNVFLLELTTAEQFNQNIQAMKDYCNNTLYEQFFPRIIEINVEREDRIYFENTFHKEINKEIQDYKTQHPLNERKQKYFERLIEPKKEK